jgi:hypothetical protein
MRVSNRNFETASSCEPRAIFRTFAWVGNLSVALFVYSSFLHPSSGYAQAANPPKKLYSAPVSSALCTSHETFVSPGGTVGITIDPGVGIAYFAFGASAGLVVVKSNIALLNTAGVDENNFPITVVCSAVNSKGETVSLTLEIAGAPPKAINSPMTQMPVQIGTPDRNNGYSYSGVVAPSLQWTTGTQTQTISGGSMLVSAVHSNSYCDAQLIQFGLAANASDTSTTKSNGVTTNLDIMM